MSSAKTAWQEAKATLWPRPEGRDGPLPPLLLTLTVVTGLVDATSYLKLGHVFVANMTGNVVFLGFGIAGAPDFAILDSLVALVSFGLGGCAGRGQRNPDCRGLPLCAASRPRHVHGHPERHCPQARRARHDHHRAH